MRTLRIIGSGVKGTLHITTESLLHLNKSRKILWLGSIEGLEELASSSHWNAEDITALYENSSLDSNNYKRIKTKILSDLEKHQSVAFITLGHPRLGVTIVQELQQENEEFELIILPGISSFDTMINDIALDPIEEGTCLLDANRLLLYDYPMDLCINYFIYHVCSIGNSKTDFNNPLERNGVSFLKEKLLKHFPKTQEIKLLSSSGSQYEKPLCIIGCIQELENLLANVSFSCTLFIPACLPSKNQINKKFLEHITGALFT